MTRARDRRRGTEWAALTPTHEPWPSEASGAAAPDLPLVVDLRDAAAGDAELTGGKAAALSAATVKGLEPLPGVVLTTAFCDELV